MANFEKVYKGAIGLSKIYVGMNLVYEKAPDDITPPTTTARPAAGTYTTAQTIYLDVSEVADTYYTTDGSTPTTGSTKYTAGILLNADTTLKYFSVDKKGNVEAVKTSIYDINVVVAPITTISPSTTVQNNIPITVTLTTDEAGAAIKYKLGTSATIYSYTGPFTVNQNSAGVASTNIKITYWAVGANATEAEKIITYDTSGAIPAKPVLTAVAGNNQVALSWGATLNTTSYTVLRDGVILAPSQYQTGTSFTDTTALNGVQYSYVVQAGNYGRSTPSDAKLATPIAAVTGYRYIRVDGYGEYYSAAGYATSRMIEVEIFSGGINRMSGKAGSTDDTVDTGGQSGSLAPTMVTDGIKGITSNTYNIWWGDPALNGNAGNAWVKFDLGASYSIDSIRYWSYPSRSARFKIWGSNNLADFGANGAHGNAVLLWDMSLNNGTSVAGATAGTNNYHEKVGGF